MSIAENGRGILAIRLAIARSYALPFVGNLMSGSYFLRRPRPRCPSCGRGPGRAVSCRSLLLAVIRRSSAVPQVFSAFLCAAVSTCRSTWTRTSSAPPVGDILSLTPTCSETWARRSTRSESPDNAFARPAMSFRSRHAAIEAAQRSSQPFRPFRRPL